MTLREISYVITVVEKQSITGAAAGLFISQPALSQAIARVERELGCRLFVRRGNATVPTEAGLLVAKRGRMLLLAHDRLVTEVRSLGGEQRHMLRFGISPFYSKYYLPRVYQHYVANNPAVHLEVVEKTSFELERMVASGDLPFCFVPEAPGIPELHYEALGEEELLLAVPPSHPVNALAERVEGVPSIRLDYVQGEPFILLPKTQKVASLQDRIIASAHLTPRTVYQTANWDTAYALTSCGMGMSILPSVLRHERGGEHGAVFYRMQGVEAFRTYAAAYLTGEALTPEALQLIDVMRTVVQGKNR